MTSNATLRAALAFLGTLSLILCAALPSFAAVSEEGAPQIMVRPFDGPKAKALNERVVKVLEEQGADLVPAGFEGPQALETDADYASVAARLNIGSFILGEAAQDNTGWKLKLTVRQGKDGTVIGSAEYTASWFPGLLTKVDEELIKTIGDLVTGAKPTELPPPDPIDTTTDDEVVEEKPRPRPLELDAGAGFLFRSFTANNPVNINGTIPTRDQSGGMANVRIGAAFYPAALFTDTFIANIGLVGHFERSLGGKTQAGDDPNDELVEGDLDTALTAYDVGVRVRLPVGSHQLGFSGAFGSHLFEIDDGATESDPDLASADGERAKLVPDVSYNYVRLGADFMYTMEEYFIKADVGLRIVNSAGDDAGQIQNERWFPRSDVGGADAALTAGYALSERFTLTLGLDFRNFFYSMNSRLSDFGVQEDNGTYSETDGRTPVAGGANDMYFTGLISARYSL